MSIDEIAHLDFAPDESEGLRERALASWEESRIERERELLLVAQGCLHEILGVMNGKDVKVEPVPKEGEGSVELVVDGMRFRVTVAKGGEDVRLLAKVRTGYSQIKSLVELGQLIKSGDVCATG